MKLRFKYSSQMRLSFKSALKRYARIVFHTIPDIFAKPTTTSSVPVFVVGCGNSGTTLLATILSRHPDVFSIGYESSIFFPVHGLSFSRKVSRLIDALTIQHGKKFSLEKTPKHVHCLERIFRILPEARVVFVTRDGRDTVASLKKRYGDLHLALDRWVTDNTPLQAWRSDPRVFLITYEDLVRGPETLVKKLCAFLNLKYQDTMLHSTNNPYQRLARGNMVIRSEQVSKPIYDNTGKWKEELSSDELELFWNTAGQTMHDLGYR